MKCGGSGPLKIAVISGFVSYWGKYPVNVLDLDDGMTVGGGEENFLRSAVGLKALGHDVDAWHYGDSGEWRGVRFRSLQEDLYKTLLTTPYDVVCSWSALRALEWAPEGSRRLFVQQLNDLFSNGLWGRVNCVVSPSESHAQQLPGWGWRGKNYAVVHNGLDEHQYRGIEVKDGYGNLTMGLVRPIEWSKRPMNVGYWSSPDRGLHYLLKAWPAIRAKVPNAKLHVFYEIDRFLRLAVNAPGPLGDRARLINFLLPAAKADPSITFHGAVPRNKLRETQFSCRVMCYPYQPIGYCEGFCGSVNQAIAAGCHVMTTPHDALPSLYNGAVTWLPKEVSAMEKALVDHVTRGLLDEEWSTKMVRAAEAHRFNYTWERSALEMEAACKGEWSVTQLEPLDD